MRRPGQESAVEAANSAQSRCRRARKPGCLDYQACRSTRDQALFFIHTRWTDEAAFEQHAELPHTVHFLTTVEPLIDHAFDVTRASRFV